MKDTIHLLLTGGTIDKTYNPLTGKLEFPESNIEKLLAQGNCSVPIEIETIFLKDSLDTTEQERTQLVSTCCASSHSKIIMTHGTDTMVQTAQAIAAQHPEKTVVLTGAMIPYSIKNSDALFNMGAAIAAVQSMDAGVYIVMNGKIFSHDKVKKDTRIGQFIPLA